MANVARHKRGKGRRRFLPKNKSKKQKKLKLVEQISPHFSITDFKCREQECTCKKKVKISMGLIGGLELLHEKCEQEITVLKGYECSEKAKKSLYKNYHVNGLAVEIQVEGMPLKAVYEQACTIEEFQGVGLDFERNVLYLDTRKENAQHWVVDGDKRIVITDENRGSTLSDRADSSR